MVRLSALRPRPGAKAVAAFDAVRESLVDIDEEVRAAGGCSSGSAAM
jgi:hypothetical protein